MVAGSQVGLLAALESWLLSEQCVDAAILFGSQVRLAGDSAAADGWSDVDLHLVTSDGSRLERIDWGEAVPGHRLCMQVVRPASSGVRKITLLFEDGEADLVLVPAGKLRLAYLLMNVGLHHRIGFISAGLNNLSTIMSGGYRFLKGERAWGKFFARVVTEMPGFRLDDSQVRQLADTALCDFLWVLQKLERGELVASQRILHRGVLETNVVLLHELRLRRGEPTFQQARRVERLVSPRDLAALQLSARLDAGELRVAAWGALAGLKSLMAELVPSWSVPDGLTKLFAPYELAGLASRLRRE
ncbi:MAG: hypothetical protein JNK23_21300 [Opitutaceae bacterium]|nr:hypothetical protein [Opitutaceae bacterium]